MDSVLGINAYSPLAGIGSNAAVTSAYGLLASELSLSTPGVVGGASAFVDLSGVGQLLSAATIFHDQLRSLQPGTATSGGGQNFGTDFASLAAETQSFVDAFNSVQSSIANINGAGNLFGGGVTGASALVQSFNTLAQASYANGNSTLTNLSQLGIAFNPSPVPGEGGSLSIDLNTLQSAFNTDAAGAFSLLSTAANAFGEQAGNFIGQAGSQYSALAALEPGSPAASLFPQTQSNGGINFGSLLLNESLNGNISLQQAILAINEYQLVSGLLG